MKRQGRASVGWVLVLVLVLFALPGTLEAKPPVRGISLHTVLSLSEYVRAQAPATDGTPLEKVRTIVIDPGHGGDNQGAIGVAEIHEKFLTLELANELREAIERAHPGTRVVLTRHWDKSMDLYRRIHLANRLNADLFISLHYNSAPHPRAVGVETYYLATEKIMPGVSWKRARPIASAMPTTTGIDRPSNAPVHKTHNEEMITLKKDLERAMLHKRSARLASMIQKRLLKQTRARNRGVKQANFGVLRGALMPAVVVEAGFLSHPDEGKRVMNSSHRAKVVKALVGAVGAFDASLVKESEKAK